MITNKTNEISLIFNTTNQLTSAKDITELLVVWREELRGAERTEHPSVVQY